MILSRSKFLWLVPSLLLVPWPAAAADPSELWKIVDGACVPHMRDGKGPEPCAIVDLAAGYAVLKDLVGASQFLLIPTARIGGIESPELLAPNAPNYWDPAWRARRVTEARLGKAMPREALSLAVNSAVGRTQNQLHIHIDCVHPDVRAALTARRDAIQRDWTAFPVPLAGHSWRSFRIDGQNLGASDPFRLLAQGDAAAAADMGKQTLAVVGMTWSDGTEGFAVLAGKADPQTQDKGRAESLQDHDCRIAK